MGQHVSSAGGRVPIWTANSDVVAVSTVVQHEDLSHAKITAPDEMKRQE